MFYWLNDHKRGRCIKLRGVLRMIILHLKKIEFGLIISIVYEMQIVPAILRQSLKTVKKWGIQLWLNFREVHLIRIKWNDYIMTRWLIPSFWVVIHEDWKLWTHNYDWLKWKVFILNYDREITSGICDRCYSSSHVATHTWDCFDWGCL